MDSAGAAILFYCVALSMVAVASAELDNSGFISMAALDCSNITTPSSSRKLVGLPVPAGVCPVRFDRMHSYGAVTSSCRGPHMTAARCCAAFKAFACPYSNLMNDISNGCADEMFFQIIVRGRLQPGLFSSICREGPEGLKC